MSPYAVGHKAFLLRFYAQYQQVVPSKDADGIARALQVSFLHAILAMRDWTEAKEDEFDTLVEKMAQQLPDNDIDRFLESVKYGFHSRAFDAGLTASIVVEPVGTDGSSASSVVYLRVRAFLEDRRKEAELPGIGLEVANALLEALPQMKQTAMMVWQDRGHDPVLIGAVRARTSMMDAVRHNPAATTLIAISGGLLVLLFILAVIVDPVGNTESATLFLGSDVVDWFKRLVGPLSSTLVASFVALLVLVTQGRARTAYWNLGDDQKVGSS